MIKYIRCQNCNRTFILSEGEQKAYKTNGKPFPTICSTCRKERREQRQAEQRRRAIEEQIEILQQEEQQLDDSCEPTEEEILEGIIIIGEAIASEMEKRNRNTAAIALNIKGLRAAIDFESFLKEFFPVVECYLKRYSEITETIIYNVILPKATRDRALLTEAIERFNRIRREAAECIAEADPEFPGMVYLYISFPAVIRIYKDSEEES